MSIHPIERVILKRGRRGGVTNEARRRTSSRAKGLYVLGALGGEGLLVTRMDPRCFDCLEERDCHLTNDEDDDEDDFRGGSQPTEQYDGLSVF